MKIATWNVNGIRARKDQLHEWVARDRPDVVCLQEIKARPEQLPPLLYEPEDYQCYWHGAGGYSGVAMLFNRQTVPEPPVVEHPPLDFECRIATAVVHSIRIASVYVPNGGKDFPAKMRFLEELTAWAASVVARGEPLVLCGDLNVAHTDMDVHPKERKATAIGQRPDERAAFDALLGAGLVDVTRALQPDNDGLFTWWAPWRNMRARNIGWRIDYVLASRDLVPRVSRCDVLAEIGTSDHAPILCEIVDALPAQAA